MAETYITNTEKSQRMLKNKNKLYRLTPIRMAIERTNKKPPNQKITSVGNTVEKPKPCVLPVRL